MIVTIGDFKEFETYEQVGFLQWARERREDGFTIPEWASTFIAAVDNEQKHYIYGLEEETGLELVGVYLQIMDAIS